MTASASDLYKFQQATKEFRKAWQRLARLCQELEAPASLIKEALEGVHGKHLQGSTAGMLMVIQAVRAIQPLMRENRVNKGWLHRLMTSPAVGLVPLTENGLPPPSDSDLIFNEGAAVSGEDAHAGD